MRWLTLVCMLCAVPTWAQADGALHFPEDFHPALDVAASDISVQMEVDEDGTLDSAKVVQSSRPELNKAVLAALREWHFNPRLADSEKPGWQATRGFAFGPPSSADAAPAMIASATTLEWQQGTPAPATVEPSQALFINRDPAAVPAALPNQLWISYAGKKGTGADPEATIDVLVGNDGQPLAARVRRATTTVLGEMALKATLSSTRFAPPRSGANETVAIAQVPVRFYKAPAVAGVLRKPDFPRELYGSNGLVTITCTVAEDGTISDPVVHGASHPQYEKAVIDVYLKGRFEPAMRLGHPQAMRWTMKYRYLSPGSGDDEPYLIGNGRHAPRALPDELQYDEPPRVTLATDPVYPYEEALAGSNGSARVSVLVDPEGKVRKVTIVEASQPAFGAALKANMEGWTFKPAMRDGKPTWALFGNRWEFSVSSFALRPLDPNARRILGEVRDGSIVEAAQLDTRLVPRVRMPPSYPFEELEAGASDEVTIEFFVDRSGAVHLPHPVKYQNEALAWAAATALSRWRFDPPLRGGKAVDARARTSMHFALAPGDSGAAAQ